jgi:hypothetical protein
LAEERDITPEPEVHRCLPSGHLPPDLPENGLYIQAPRDNWVISACEKLTMAKAPFMAKFCKEEAGFASTQGSTDMVYVDGTS